jgi:hypothetical protein
MVLLMRGKVEGRLFDAREVEHSALGKLPIHSALNESGLSHSLTLSLSHLKKERGLLDTSGNVFILLLF